jgi:hypothetical protein
VLSVVLQLDRAGKREIPTPQTGPQVRRQNRVEAKKVDLRLDPEGLTLGNVADILDAGNYGRFL